MQTLAEAMEEAYNELVAAYEANPDQLPTDEPRLPPDVEERMIRTEAEESGMGHLYDPVR